MNKLVLALASFGLTSTMSNVACADGISLEANGAHADDRWGGELGLGYGFGFGGFTIRPGGGVFIYQGDNDRYFEETFSNGRTVCRDNTNGQFADSEDCDNTALKAYGRLEATYTIPLSAEIGIGGRYSGDEIEPYATVSFPIAPVLRLKGNAGPDYFAVGLRADF